MLDALGIKNADVLGWSMGGMIAQELVLNHPDKVNKDKKKDNKIITGARAGGGELSAGTINKP